MRSNSFTDAAVDLHVTPGAVGQHIQKLEEWLGIDLFVRQVRRVTPTDDAVLYWQRIQPALEQIVEASQSLKKRGSRGVRLSMPPAFAAKWFTRRMADFIANHPEVELLIDSSSKPVDFERDQIDLAVRHFNGNDPRLTATLLYQDEARVYCNPHYLRQTGILAAADIRHGTLLHSTTQAYWAQWIDRFCPLDKITITAIPGIYFDQTLLAIEAARRGQGLVLSSPVLVEEEIREGTLVDPFGLCLPVSAGYHVVHPRDMTLNQATQHLKSWLLRQAQNSLADAAGVAFPPKPAAGW